MDQPIGLTVREALGILALLLSLAGNGFQLYRHGVYRRTVHHGLVAAFNSVGWLVVRCMNAARDLSDRIERTEKWAPQQGIMVEFRNFSVDTEFMLRELHEQLVASAKTLQAKDARWQVGEFGYTHEEIEKFRRAFTDRS